MHIYSKRNNTYNTSPNFGINLQSNRLQFRAKDFYVNIEGYGRHYGWAKKIIEAADDTVDLIRADGDFETILLNVTQGVREANYLPLDLEKNLHTGILRINRAGWRHSSSWMDNNFVVTKYSKHSQNQYSTYADRLDYIAEHPLDNPYRDVHLTRPRYDKCYYGRILLHPSGYYIDSAFKRLDSIYGRLHKRYISNEAKSENLSDINSSIAEMRWILAHATPFERGSDAISNTFIRSVYKAMGIKTYPLRKGVSLDMEAYCTNLKEYKANFPEYFVKKPRIVD